ncbi:hypothetical protein H6P81_008772 [Aristolochia fimbriata]|uniref:Uncharacterized protein n=1 Tax=Aristolochia fimbriata TaxID=158543 RepID=A0AAV7EIY0_ARIFI|nr:hypothetical protein H6P81_008772 [Aristolochia fimbriata]
MGSLRRGSGATFPTLLAAALLLLNNIASFLPILLLAESRVVLLSLHQFPSAASLDEGSIEILMERSRRHGRALLGSRTSRTSKPAPAGYPPQRLTPEPPGPPPESGMQPQAESDSRPPPPGPPPPPPPN